MDVRKGDVEVIEEVEREIMKYIGKVWTDRQRNYMNRATVLPQV